MAPGAGSFDLRFTLSVSVASSPEPLSYLENFKTSSDVYSACRVFICVSPWRRPVRDSRALKPRVRRDWISRNLFCPHPKLTSKQIIALLLLGLPPTSPPLPHAPPSPLRVRERQRRRSILTAGG